MPVNGLERCVFGAAMGKGSSPSGENTRFLLVVFFEGQWDGESAKQLPVDVVNETVQFGFLAFRVASRRIRTFLWSVRSAALKISSHIGGMVKLPAPRSHTSTSDQGDFGNR